MKERIKKLRKTLDLNQTEFAEKLNITQAHESSMEKGKREPTDRTISDICREFNVNEEWLRSGTGDMFKEMTEQDIIKQKIDNQLKDGDEFTKNVLYQIASLTPEEWKAIEEFIYKIKK
ncbi:MAG: helix-turn-helix transcriptional regulator [Lachnospiraceae bacterium]|nr:helix-turn-helix transcriptional regulator [Lachnospiraceae bacterium]